MRQAQLQRMRSALARHIRRFVKFFCSPSQSKQLIALKAAVILSIYLAALIAWRAFFSQATDSFDTGEKLTVIVNTFKRLDLLKNSVQHYSACPVVRRVHVNWAESTTPPDVEKCKCCDTEVTFALPLLTHNDSSLNTRFMPIPDLQTEAVLNIDDDITVSCDVLKRTFATWRHHREQLVGWFPRYVTTDGHRGSLDYHNHQKTLTWDQKYNVALTKGAIMHKKYLQLYTDTVPKDLLTYVAKGRNCEDILMQYVVSSQTSASPVFVWDMKLSDAGAGWKPQNKGISKDSSHMRDRSACVRLFEQTFAPLQHRSIWSHRNGFALMVSPFLDSMHSLFSGLAPPATC
eukprot:jgi/Ulvmu1/2823/UM142_0021.1